MYKNKLFAQESDWANKRFGRPVKASFPWVKLLAATSILAIIVVPLILVINIIMQTS